MERGKGEGEWGKGKGEKGRGKAGKVKGVKNVFCKLYSDTLLNKSYKSLLFCTKI